MKLRITAVAAALALASSATFAAPGDRLGGGNIIFEGAVSTDTCFVDSASGDDTTIRVNTGTVNAVRITGDIDSPTQVGGGDISFTINCSTDSAVKLSFQAPGSLIEGTKILKINDGITGDARLASGFGIAVYKAGGAAMTDANAIALADGTLFTGTVAAASPQPVAFQAGYVKTGSVTGGIAKATLPFVMLVP